MAKCIFEHCFEQELDKQSESYSYLNVVSYKKIYTGNWAGLFGTIQWLLASCLVN